MIQIIFLFFGILAMIYLIVITEPLYKNKKNVIPELMTIPIPNFNIYHIDVNPTKNKILWKNNKKRKQKRKT
jgi:hypothetical protein